MSSVTIPSANASFQEITLSNNSNIDFKLVVKSPIGFSVRIRLDFFSPTRGIRNDARNAFDGKYLSTRLAFETLSVDGG